MRFVTATALFGGSCWVTAVTLAAPPAQSVPTAENIKIAAPAAAAQFTPQNGYTGDLTLLNKPASSVGANSPTRNAPIKPAGGAKVAWRFGSTSNASSKRSEDVAPLQPGIDPMRFDQQLPKGGVALPLLDDVNAGKNGAIRFVPGSYELMGPKLPGN